MEKAKKILLVLSGLAVIVILLIMVLPSNSINNTTSNSFVVDQTVKSLRFTNANISNNAFNVRVQNTTPSNYALKSITVNFIDQNNNNIVSIDGYIGEEIKPNEIRNLNIKTDVDLSNLKNITYVVNK